MLAESSTKERKNAEEAAAAAKYDQLVAEKVRWCGTNLFGACG